MIQRHRLLHYVEVVSRKSTVCLFDTLLITSDYLPARFSFIPSRFGNICSEFTITMLKNCLHIPEIERRFFSSHNAEKMHVEQTWNLCIPERHSLLQPEAEQISQEFVYVETSRINSCRDIFRPRKRQTRILRVTKLYFDLLRTTAEHSHHLTDYPSTYCFLYRQHLSDVCFSVTFCVCVSLTTAQERVFRSDGVQLCRVAQSNLFSPRALFHRRSYDRTCEAEKGGRADKQRK